MPSPRKGHTTRHSERVSAPVAGTMAAHRRHSTWQRVVSALAVVVVFCTTYALILPAITMTKPTYCGYEEHEHTEACYANDGTLTCELEEHAHADECYEVPESLQFDFEDEYISATITLSWVDGLPADLQCEVAQVDDAEADANYEQLVSALIAAVEDGSKTTDSGMIYSLHWTSGGESYTLPAKAQPTVKITQLGNQTDGQTLLGASFAETDDGEYTAETTASGDDSTTVTLTLDAGTAYFAMAVAVDAEEQVATVADTGTGGGYWYRVSGDSNGNYSFDSSKQYLIMSPNGNYRLTYTQRMDHGRGLSTQLNPVRGNDGYYTLQCTVCGGTITPSGHINDEGNVCNTDGLDSQYSKTTDSIWRFTPAVRNKKTTTCYDIDHYAGISNAEYGDSLYIGPSKSLSGDAIHLEWREDEQCWWLEWWNGGTTTTGYYLGCNGEPNRTNEQTSTFKVDGHSLYAAGSNNTRTNVYAQFDVNGAESYTNTTPFEETGERNFLIFEWRTDSLTITDEEKESVSLTRPTEKTEESYTYTSAAASVTKEDESITNVVSGATADITSTQSTSDSVAKTLGDTDTTSGTSEQNATAYAAQSANDGRVVTNKSIIYGDDDYDVFSDYEQDEFSVTLSAQAQEWGDDDSRATLGVPVDVMFAFDLSKTMVSDTSKWQSAVSSINASMKYILEQNANNRVGLVVYGNNAVTVMELDNADTYGRSGNYITYTGSDYTTLACNGHTLNNSNSEFKSGSNGLLFDQSFMQLGIQKAYEAFPDYRNDSSSYKKRQPMLLLVSDGNPTMATGSYMTPDEGPYYGDGSATGATGFWSVMSAQYFKNILGNKYGIKAIFYSIGVTSTGSASSLSDYERIVLNPSSASLSALVNWSSAYGSLQTDGSVTQAAGNLKRLLLAVRSDDGDSSNPTTEGLGGSGGTFVESVGSSGATEKGHTVTGYGYTNNWLRAMYNPYKSTYATGYAYCDELISTSSTLSSTGLADIFKSVSLANNYDFTLDDSDEYVTFTDTLGDNITIQSTDTDGDGTADTDDIRLLWYKTENASSKTSTTNATPVALTYDSKATSSSYYGEDSTEETVVYTWNTATAYRTGATESGSSYTGGPDSKQYGTDTMLQSLATSPITATVTTKTYTDSTGRAVTKQTIEWKIPASVLPSLYPDLYTNFYYEEQPVRLVYRVGLSDEGIDESGKLGKGETLKYTVQDDASPAAVSFTAAASNPYYSALEAGSTTNYAYSSKKLASTTSETPVTSTTAGDVVLSESISATRAAAKSVTQTLYAAGTLDVTGSETITYNLKKSWLPDDDDGGNIEVEVKIYQAVLGVPISYTYTDTSGVEQTVPLNSDDDRENAPTVAQGLKVGDSEYDPDSITETTYKLSSTDTVAWQKTVRGLPTTVPETEADTFTLEKRDKSTNGTTYTITYKKQDTYSYFLKEDTSLSGYTTTVKFDGTKITDNSSLKKYRGENPGYDDESGSYTYYDGYDAYTLPLQSGDVDIVNIKSGTVPVDKVWADADEADHSNDNDVTLYIYRYVPDFTADILYEDDETDPYCSCGENTCDCYLCQHAGEWVWYKTVTVSKSTGWMGVYDELPSSGKEEIEELNRDYPADCGCLGLLSDLIEYYEDDNAGEEGYPVFSYAIAEAPVAGYTASFEAEYSGYSDWELSQVTEDVDGKSVSKTLYVDADGEVVDKATATYEVTPYYIQKAGVSFEDDYVDEIDYPSFSGVTSITVTNTPAGYELPQTGGSGTTPLAVIGGLLVCGAAAGLALVGSRRAYAFGDAPTGFLAVGSLGLHAGSRDPGGRFSRAVGKAPLGLSLLRDVLSGSDGACGHSTASGTACRWFGVVKAALMARAARAPAFRRRKRRRRGGDYLSDA